MSGPVGAKFGNNTQVTDPTVGTVTSVNVNTANGVSATGGPITTSGSFTFTLGAITPTAVNGMAITTNSGTLHVGNAKSVDLQNSVTYVGTDGTTVTTPGQTCSLGYLNMPQNSKSADYELVALDSGKQVYHPATDANSRQFTIPKNATVAYALGTCVTFTNDSADDITVVIDTDTLNYADTGAVTTITIPQYNTVTVQKTTTTSWLASGSSGVTTA